MPDITPSVALAVRAHPHGSAFPGASDPAVSIRAAATAVGEKHPDALRGPSSVSAQGVLMLPLAEPRHILQVVLKIAESLRPARATFSAAVIEHGATSGTAIDSAVLAAVQAEELAAAGIDETHPREGRFVLLTPGPDRVIGALVSLLLEAYDGMTDRQRQIVSLIRESETQQQVAKHLDVTRQAVNQSLAAAGWSHLRLAEDAVTSYLESRWPAGRDAGRSLAKAASDAGAGLAGGTVRAVGEVPKEDP